MDSTEGLVRGTEVTDTGDAIKVPTGDALKGRLLNVVGSAIDGIGELDNKEGRAIHQEAPTYEKPVYICRAFVHRYQGDRSDRALRQGW